MLTWGLPRRIPSYHYQEGPNAYECGTSCTFLSFIIDFLQFSDLHLHQPQALSSNGSSLSCMCEFSLYPLPTPAPSPPSLPTLGINAPPFGDTVVIKTDTFCILEGPSRDPLFFMFPPSAPKTPAH